MNSTQYYHPYPSPSQTQAQLPHQQQQQVLSPQQQALSPQQQHQQQQQQQVLSPPPQVLSPQHQHQQHPLQSSVDASSQAQQQQLSPQQSPSHHQSPVQQHANHISLDGSTGSSSAANNNNNNTSTSANNSTGNNGNSASHHGEHHHSPSHSNDAQSPIDADGDIIPGGQSSQTANPLPSPPGSQGQGHPTSLLPMPSPVLAAATAANTAANTATSTRQQMILQYEQQHHPHHPHQQHQSQMNMTMSMPMQGAAHPGAINTMIPFQGPSAYMLPSPQSAGTQPPPPPPAVPPQGTDLESILSKFANQPELLKMIIASKTEEDRRWAEEARYRMMDLFMRGDARATGMPFGAYEQLGAVPGQIPNAMMGMTAKRFMEEGNGGGNGGYNQHPMFPAFPPGGPTGPGGAAGQGTAGGAHGAATGLLSTMSPTSATPGSNAAGFSSMYAPTSQIPNAFGIGGMGGMGGMGGQGSQAMMNPGVGGATGSGNGLDPSLARKRSVTFAEVHHNHMRSQSLSSVPTQSTASQFGGMNMLGMNGGADTFGQAGPHHPSSMTAPGMPPSQPYPFPQQQQQQQQSQQQQQAQQQQQQQPPTPQPMQQQGQPPTPIPQTQMHFHHHGSPMFNGSGPYSHSTFGQQHMSVYHPSGIRRTNSLSHISQTTTISEQRLAAGRPRNDSSNNPRNMEDQDSDDDSDDDYDSHPVMGMASRPGSALSIHNSIGGTGETTLSLDFSDMASVSGHSHHEQSNGTAGTPPTSSSSSAPSSSTSQAKSHHRSSSSISSMAGVGAGSDQKRKRKRREMQPVKETIHSNELYNDPYVWKNNGNTIQKKTGCKSIYYKCSNSTAGCTVNKTVTEKEGGGYVTKYRGQHLDDCHRLKKAQMSSQGANGHRSMPKEQ